MGDLWCAFSFALIINKVVLFVFTFCFLWLACNKNGHHLTDVFPFSFSNWPWCCKFDQWRRSKNHSFDGLSWYFSIQISDANDEVIYHCSSRKLPKSSWGIVCGSPSSSCQSYCTDISSSKIIFSPTCHLITALLYCVFGSACFIQVPCCDYAYYANVTNVVVGLGADSFTSISTFTPKISIPYFSGLVVTVAWFLI